MFGKKAFQHIELAAPCCKTVTSTGQMMSHGATLTTFSIRDLTFQRLIGTFNIVPRRLTWGFPGRQALVIQL